ncbi:hypothetical protein GCM10020000_47940 [Streptomyces olivoverticillatus]
MWWVLEEPKRTWIGPYLVATVTPEGDENAKPDPALPQQLSDEYGLDHSSSGRAQKTVQQLTSGAKPS